MIKLQGTDKLQHYFENSSWCVLETIIEINTFSIDIEMYKDILIDIEILIYDPFTNWFVPSQLIVFKRTFHKHSISSVLNYYSAISKFVTCPSSPVAFLDNFKSTSQLFSL